MEPLADLCRWKIFNHLQEDNILSFAEPKFSWSQFKRTFVSPRSSLIVLIGTNPVALIESYETLFYLDNRGNVQKRNSLLYYSSVPKCAPISREHVQFLVDLFPRTTELVVVFDKPEFANDLGYVIDLLAHFGPQLVSLSLYVAYRTSNINNRRSDRLLTVINSMLNLRRLKLHFKKPLFKKARADERQIEIRLPILARLEHFEYDLRDSIGQLYSSLTSHAQSNENLQNIQLNSQIKPRYHNDLLAPTEFALRFRSLNLDITPKFGNEYIPLFPDICDHFVNLSHLHIRLLILIPQYRLIRALAPLRQLTFFSLKLCMEALQWLSADRPVPELPSVKIFRMMLAQVGLYAYSHSILPEMQLNKVFPNIQVLRLSTKIEAEYAPRGSNVPLLVAISRTYPKIFKVKEFAGAGHTALVGHFICRACLKKGLDIVECHRQTVESLVESCDKLSRIEIGNSAYLIGD